MRKLISLVIIGLMLSTPLTILVPNANAAGKAKGVIRDVDLRAGTVTIAARDGGVTLKVDGRTQITRNGEAARLSDLQITDKAQARYDSETLVARRIDARGGEDVRFERVEGAVAAVDEQAGTLSIAPVSDGGSLLLNVTDKTYVTLDGQETRLAELASGFSAGVMYSADTMEAVRVQAESFSEVRGIVRDVSVPLSTLTIATGGGDRSLTLKVAPGTPISLNDRPATLDDLRRGFEVVAGYVAASLQAVRVAATSRAEVQGVIRAVDSDADTVTISPLVDGAPVQVHVTASTAITVDGERAEMERLQPGMPAKAVFNLGSFEALSIAARSEGAVECTPAGVAGSILRVDLEGGHVAIHPADGVNALTLNVTNRTEITLNGRPARLSDLAAGMRVEARFCRESLNATSIAAHSDGGGDCSLVGVSGSIARVDVEGGHVIISPADQTTEAALLTLNVTNRTEVTLNGRPVRLHELAAGMRVEARFCRETLDAAVIAARSDTGPDCTLAGVAGSIVRVDVEGGRLVINPGAPGTEAALLTLNVTNRTEITLNGRPVRLAELAAGMRVEARFCRETLDATVIAARSDTGGGGGDCTAASAAGLIAAVEAERGHLTIATETSPSALTLNVTDRTEITLNGRPVRLSDLRAGMRVEARFCRETSNAMVIAARTATP
jgi:Cu/Ag efflux protein CusF